VVNITEYVKQGSQVVPLGQGSGFVYDEKGHIITNAHVVEGADELEVTFSDGTIQMGTLVGKDLNSDLAIVKVQKLPNGVQPLPLGDISQLAVGQTVVAIGNPFGLEGTLTRGIISALGRSIPALTPFTIPQAIQTDAAINPGNSGGPLLNLQGEVIGVNAQIETGGETRANTGVGFAIPVSIIKLVIPDLIEKGKHDWAWLGVRGGTLNPWIREAMKLDVDKGAYIAEVVAGGPSDKAGLHGSSKTVTLRGREIEIGGDVVVAINGQPVRSFDDLLIYVSLNSKPGDVVVLTIIRNGKTQEVKVTLESRPENLGE
jgi:2-alkenal reductase